MFQRPLKVSGVRPKIQKTETVPVDVLSLLSHDDKATATYKITNFLQTSQHPTKPHCLLSLLQSSMGF